LDRGPVPVMQTVPLRLTAIRLQASVCSAQGVRPVAMASAPVTRTVRVAPKTAPARQGNVARQRSVLTPGVARVTAIVFQGRSVARAGANPQHPVARAMATVPRANAV
jgi:hypothetical protein